MALRNPFQAASLRARPAYTPGPQMQPVTPPSLAMPDMPSLPDLPTHATAPNALNRQWLTQQLTNLPGQYNPALTGARGAAQEALAGYGGWRWQSDNPATPAREDLAVPTKDGTAQLGERERQAVQASRYAANAAGMLDSSFANKAVGAAVTQLNEEAKGIVRQYAANINSLIGQQRQQSTDIIGDLVRLYGEDARWLAENPPPPPPEPPPAPAATPEPGPAPGEPGGAMAPGQVGPNVSNQVSWAAKPNITPEAVAAKWGPEARLIQTRSGMWTIDLGGGRGWATTDKPAPKPLAEWDNEPDLTVAQVERKYGKGARVRRAGNGKYVIRLAGGGRG